MAFHANSDHQPHPTRRTIVKGAAWATPVIAVAIATPAAAASEDDSAPNDLANYYWAAESTGQFTTLAAAGSGNIAQFSTQIAYRSDPYYNPPPGGVLQILVAFDREVTIVDDSLTSGWTVSVTSAGPGVLFTLEKAPSGQGGGLTFRVEAEASGELNTSSAMNLMNPERPNTSDATFSNESSTASATLVG